MTPLQLANAYAALANGGTLYSPRIGRALVSPSGHVDQRINPPVLAHVPASKYTLSYIRNALAGVVTSGTAAGAFAGFPLNKVCVAGKTGTAQSFGNNATSVFASFAPCQHPKYVVLVMLPGAGYGAAGAAPAVRQIYDGIFGLEGKKAALPGGQTAGPPAGGDPVTGMVVGRYRPTRSAIVMRAVAKKGLLRQFDWLLVAVAVALTVIGTLLIWSATAPALEQAGLDPRMYLKKQVLNAFIGVVLMFVTASFDYRRYRAATPVLYVLSLLLLLAVLTPAGTTVNGAKAWIALPGGFQVEPSEFAKLALILMTALLLSRKRGVGRSGADAGGRASGGWPWPPLAAVPLMALVATEPALGVTLVLVFVLAGMIVVSGLRWYWLAGLASAVRGRHLRRLRHAPDEGLPGVPADRVPAPAAGPVRGGLQPAAGQDRGGVGRDVRHGAVPRDVHRQQLRPLAADRLHLHRGRRGARLRRLRGHHRPAGDLDHPGDPGRGGGR